MRAVLGDAADDQHRAFGIADVQRAERIAAEDTAAPRRTPSRRSLYAATDRLMPKVAPLTCEHCGAPVPLAAK